MADEIVVYDGEKPNVIARFDAGVSGKSVLSLTQLKAGRTGTVERSADGRTITEESQNLSAGNYRFIAAPAPPPAGAAGLTKEELVDAFVQAQKRAKSDQVSISQFNAGHWGRMSERLGVKLELCPSHQLAVARDAGAASMEAFHWTDVPEPAQADRYLPYLKQLIPFDGQRRYPLVWLEAGSMNKGLLDLQGFEDRLYYSSITGNADVVIITRDSYDAKCPREGLCMLFELKKEVELNAVFQAACELIAAAILSPSWQPIVVLTDLAEHWQVFWMSGATVKHAMLLDRGAAAAVIKGCVQQAAAQASGQELEDPVALPPVLADRQVADLQGRVHAAAVGEGAAVNPDLLGLDDMLPAGEMQEVYAQVLLRQVSMLPAFSSMGHKGHVAGMYS